MKTKANNILPGMESEIMVGGSELADWLCVTPSAVTRMTENRRLEKGEGGKYPLKASVQSVIRDLRGRKTGQGESKDLERSAKYWQVENTKQKVLSWRLQFGKDMALRILGSLESALMDLQRSIAEDSQANAAVLKFSENLKNIRLDELDLSDDDLLGAGDDQ
ncbi:MAG: hypothetical protein ACI4SG_00670 [Oligosphaeraceae bacterium]